jgi:hypothetical protein
METILNLVWLAVTVAGVCLWRFRWTVSRKNPTHSMRMEAVAMVCILALLFPVISLTDDLHPEIALMDASSGKRNASLIAACAPHVRDTTPKLGTHLALGIISRPFGAANFIFSEFFPFAKPHDSARFIASSAGRSPPLLV